jgi:hypothetical protein
MIRKFSEVNEVVDWQFTISNIRQTSVNTTNSRERQGSRHPITVVASVGL